MDESQLHIIERAGAAAQGDKAGMALGNPRPEHVQSVTSQDRRLSMIPITADQHMQNVGVLIEQLRSIEYSARVAIRSLTQDGSPPVDFARLRKGDWVPEDAVTNYDQLDAVLKRFNELAPARCRVDARRLVDLRHQLAHGRLVAVTSPPKTTTAQN